MAKKTIKVDHFEELLSKVGELTEAKKALPIGTIGVWASGTKIKFAAVSPSVTNKNPNNWKLLTSKVKLQNAGDPPAFFHPGTQLPPELQGFADEVSKLTGVYAKSPQNTPVKVTPPEPKAPAHTEPPEAVEPKDAEKMLQKQGSETPAADKEKAAEKELSKEKEATPAPTEPDHKVDVATPTNKEPEKANDGLVAVEPTKPPAKTQGLSSISGLPSKEELDDCESSLDYHMWGIKLFQKIQKAIGLPDGAGTLSMMEVLHNNKEHQEDLASLYGDDWFAKYGDAYLINFGNKNAAKDPAIAKIGKTVFGANWYANYQKLKSGSPIGSIGAAIKAKPIDPNLGQATPVLVQEPQNTTTLPTPSPEKPIAASEPSLAPTPSQIQQDKAAENDKVDKLVKFVDQAIVAHNNNYYSALLDPKFTSEVLKTFGSGWKETYTAKKAELTAAAKMAVVPPVVDPIAKTPAAVDPVANEKPVPFVEPLKAIAKEIEKEISHGQAMVQDIDSTLALAGYSSLKELVDQAKSGNASAVHYYKDLNNKYGSFLVPDYNSAKAKLGATPSVVAKDSDKIEFDAIEASAVVADVDKYLHQEGMYLTLADPINSVQDGSYIDILLKNKFGKNWKDKYKAGLSSFVQSIDTAMAANYISDASNVPPYIDLLMKEKYGKGKGGWIAKFEIAKAALIKSPKELTMVQNQLIADVDTLLGTSYLHKNTASVLNKIANGYGGIGKALIDKYGKDWADEYEKYKNTKEAPLVNAAGSGTAVAPMSLQAQELVKAVDQLLTTSGIPVDQLDSLVGHTATNSKFSAKWGQDWAQEYKTAKGLDGFGTVATPAISAATPANAPTDIIQGVENELLAHAYSAKQVELGWSIPDAVHGILKAKYGIDYASKYMDAKKELAAQAAAKEPAKDSTYSFIKGQKGNKADIVAAVEATAKHLGYSAPNFETVVDYVSKNPFFKAKMKAVFGQQWASQAKKGSQFASSTTPTTDHGLADDVVSGITDLLNTDHGWGPIVIGKDYDWTYDKNTFIDQINKPHNKPMKDSIVNKYGQDALDKYFDAFHAQKSANSTPQLSTAAIEDIKNILSGTGGFNLYSNPNKLLSSGWDKEGFKDQMNMGHNANLKQKLVSKYGEDWIDKAWNEISPNKDLTTKSTPKITKTVTKTDADKAKEAEVAKQTIANNLVGTIPASEDSLVPTVQNAINKAYASDPSLWKHNSSSVLPELNKNAAFVDAMEKKFGKDWQNTYDAIVGTLTPTSTHQAISGYVFPDTNSLTPAGSAKHLGGNKDKYFYKDSLGNTFLFKPSENDPIRAAAGEMSSNLASIIFSDDGLSAYVPVKSTKTAAHGLGSIQPFQADVKTDLSKINLNSLSKDQLRQMIRERVFDWATSNHDSKADQFLVMNDGSIKGVDKEQAYKFVGKDQLSLDYAPNEHAPVYNDLFKRYTAKSLDLDLNDALSYIEKIENTSDDDWVKIVAPYIDVAAVHEGADPDALKSKILARKNSMRKDFEKFFTDLKIKRGDLNPGQEFNFNSTSISKAPQKITKTSELPYANELSFHSHVTTPGSGFKAHYIDPSGKKYLFKLPQDSSGVPSKPYASHVQEGFSKTALALKPGSLPVKSILVMGDVGTIQPTLPEGAEQLVHMHHAPSLLSLKQKISLGGEQILDWLGSNHGSTGDNLYTVGDEVFGHNKEGAFKFFNFGAGDKLSTDFNPNYPQPAPYYNKFWDDWKEGKFQFDPQTLAKFVNAAEAIPDDQYKEQYKPYAASLYKDDPASQDKFLNSIVARKKSLRKDFEAFVTDLYSKKTKQEGQFTFKGGWKKGKKNIQTIVHTHSAAEAATKEMYGNIQQKPYKDVSGGAGDPNKLTLKMSVGEPKEKLEKFLADFGLQKHGDIITGPVNYVAVVDKKAFNSAHTTTTETIDLSYEALPQTAAPLGFAQLPQHKEAKPNISELFNIHETKIGPSGHHLMMGGSAVEGQAGKVIKHIGEDGKPYYMAAFKLTEPTWSPLSSSGSTGKLAIPSALYDNDHGAYKNSSGSLFEIGSRVWKNGKNEVHLLPGDSKYSFKGYVFAKVYPEEGKSVADSMKSLVDKMQPGLAQKVFSDPTPEEQHMMKLRRLAWATHKKDYQKLGKNPSEQAIKAMLLKHGVGDSHIDAVKTVKTVAGHHSHVLPGRYKKLLNGKFRYLSHGVHGEDTIASILGHGLLGVNERYLHGFAGVGASVPSDIASGSGDGILTHWVSDDTNYNLSSMGCSSGPYQVIISPEEADRLDAYAHPSDSYGNCQEGNSSWEAVVNLGETMKQCPNGVGGEMSFRKGISPDRFLRIAASNDTIRKNLIKACKKKGILEHNGVPIDDFIVVGNNSKDIYNLYVKPSGY